MTGPVINTVTSIDFIAARNWLKNLVAVFISSGASAAYAWAGLACGHAMDATIPVLNWEGLVAVFVFRGFWKVLEVLGTNPLPGVTMAANGSVKSYSAASGGTTVASVPKEPTGPLPHTDE